MRFAWMPGQQRRFEWLLSALRLADRVIPHRAWLLGLPDVPLGYAFAGMARQANRLAASELMYAVIREEERPVNRTRKSACPTFRR
jgi:uncharacterized protein (DUF2236 family)